MLGSEGDSLIYLLVSQAFAEERGTILCLRLLMHLPGQVLEALTLTILVHDLLSEHVDLPLQVLVLRLGLVEAELLVLDGVLLTVQFDVVKLVLDSLWSDMCNVLVLLAELIFDLLDLIFKDL